MELTKQMFLDFDEKKRVYKKGEYYASEIPCCHLRMYYRRINTGITEKCNERMAMGKIIHHIIPEILPFKTADLHFESKMNLYYNGFTLKGTADALDSDTVYEFKFSGMDKVTSSALAQANTYCGMSGRKKSSIFMINSGYNSGYYSVKNLLEVNRFDQGFDNEHYAMMLDILTKTHELIMSEKPDPDEFPRSPSFVSECALCSFNKICRKRD